MNRMECIGNLCKDPELRMTNGGVSVCTFSVAVPRKFKNEQGERLTDFFNVVVWRALAENVHEYTHKGSKVFISGQLQNRSYDAKDGSKRYVTEIIADEVEFLDPPQKSARGRTEPYVGDTGTDGTQQSFGDAIDDEDLPF